MKKCPFCGEEIQDVAIICRYCGRELDPKKVQEITKSYQEPETKEPLDRSRVGTTFEQDFTQDYTQTREPGTLSTKRSSALGTGIAVGILLAVFSSVYRLIEYGNCISTYGGSSLVCHGMFQDLLWHFLSNLVIWILVITTLIYAVRKKWKNVGLSLLFLILSILLLTLASGIFSGTFVLSSILPIRTGNSPTALSKNQTFIISTLTPTLRGALNTKIPQVESTSEVICDCPWGSFEEVSNLASGTEICVSGRVSTQGQIGYLYWVDYKGTDEWRRAFIRLKNLPLYYEYFAPDTIVDLNGIVGRDEDGKTVISVEIANIRACK